MRHAFTEFVCYLFKSSLSVSFYRNDRIQKWNKFDTVLQRSGSINLQKQTSSSRGGDRQGPKWEGEMSVPHDNDMPELQLASVHWPTISCLRTAQLFVCRITWFLWSPHWRHCKQEELRWWFLLIHFSYFVESLTQIHCAMASRSSIDSRADSLNGTFLTDVIMHNYCDVCCQWVNRCLRPGAPYLMHQLAGHCRLWVKFRIRIGRCLRQGHLAQSTI